MPVSRTPFEPPLVDPALAAMDVDTYPPGPDTVHEAEAMLPPVVREEFPLRPIVLPEPGRAMSPEITSAASSLWLRLSRPLKFAIAGAGSNSDAFTEAVPPSFEIAQRENFERTFQTYLEVTGKSYPTAAQRTFRGAVLDLADIMVGLQAVAGYSGMPKTQMQFTLDEWAIVAYRVFPCAPCSGHSRGAWKTDDDIATGVRDIFDRYIDPMISHRKRFLAVYEDGPVSPTGSESERNVLASGSGIAHGLAKSFAHSVSLDERAATGRRSLVADSTPASSGTSQETHSYEQHLQASNKVVLPRPLTLSDQSHPTIAQTSTNFAASSSSTGAASAHAMVPIPSASSHAATPGNSAAQRSAPSLDSRIIRRIEEFFSYTYSRYLILTRKPFPTAAQRTVHGSVLRLVNILIGLESCIKIPGMLKPNEHLKLSHWAVVAFRVVPLAPFLGSYRNAPKTSLEIATAVHDIYQTHLQPFRDHLQQNPDQYRRFVHRPEQMQATAAAAANNEIPAQSAKPAAALVGPAETDISISLIAVSAAAEPDHAASVAPRISLQAFYTQFLNDKYCEYLQANGLMLPSETERTVGGKVIDLGRLLWFMNGCRIQLRRSLTAGDMAGLAVAHFNFPPHKHYFLGDQDWRSFWGSTPEVAHGLIELYNKHLRAFETHLGATEATWHPHLITRAKDLGVVLADIETMQFIHATDIAVVANGESAAARAIGFIADERPGVTGATGKSAAAQKHFALTLGFSPFVDIVKRVFERVAEVEPNEIRNRLEPSDLVGDDASPWVQVWKVFSRHHERAVMTGPKHIHETLKDDSESEKLLFMMSAHDSMYIERGVRAATDQDICSTRPEVPPRRNFSIDTVRKWNEDYERIWKRFDRLEGPTRSPSRKVLYPLAPVNGAKVPPMKVDVRGYRPGDTTCGDIVDVRGCCLPSNHHAHTEKVVRVLASLRKSTTLIQLPSGSTPAL